MKKNIILLLLATFVIFPAYSQLKSPAASPKSKIYQEVGLVEIRIDYSRPSKKGREIFGDLVPLNKIWRTGANSPTTIFFSEDACKSTLSTPTPGRPITFKVSEDSMIFFVTAIGFFYRS